MTGERIDDLGRNGYRILQNPKEFCFGMDAVLLAEFARISPAEQVLDLGTGTGILPILMEARAGGGRFTGLEIQPSMADMASRSVQMNGLEERIRIVCGDIREASSLFGKASFDVVVSNPPYIKASDGLHNPSSGKAIARHELLCTLEDVIREACLCVRPGGRFCMVHRPNRLPEIFSVLQKYRLEPKRLRMVHAHAEDPANLVLLEAVRGGNAWMKAEPPLITYREDGTYTEEVYRLYYGDDH